MTKKRLPKKKKNEQISFTYCEMFSLLSITGSKWPPFDTIIINFGFCCLITGMAFWKRAACEGVAGCIRLFLSIMVGINITCEHRLELKPSGKGSFVVVLIVLLIG